VTDFGADQIIADLGRCGTEASADVVVSTAHRAKGREWDTVQIGNDFPRPGEINPKTGEERGVTDEEARLIYVAVTRAKLHLDTYGLDDGDTSFLPWARARMTEETTIDVTVAALDAAPPRPFDAKADYIARSIAPYVGKGS
jgi:ATP-dependent exoDNAse (exonuclease V) beta subunit